MKKLNKNKKRQQPLGRVPQQPRGITELTEHDLEQVQGGAQDSMKIPSGEGIGKR